MEDIPVPPLITRLLRSRALWALVLLALLGLGLWSWLRPPAAPVLELAAAPLRQSLQFSARVASPRRVELGSTLTGRVRSVALREGERVQQGQVLLELDDAEWRAAAEQARALAQQSRERLRGQREQGLVAAEAQRAQAAAQLAAAQRDYQRSEELVAAGFLSPARLDDARRALDSAEAAQRAADAALQGQAARGPDAAAALAQWRAAEAAAAAAEAKLAQARLLAVGDGQLLARSAEPGQIVQPGKALLVQSVDGPQELIALVDERYLSQLQAGQTARVLADAYPQQGFEARLLRLAPLVDAQRGAVQVWLRPEGQAPAFLREDMTLSVELLTAQRERALAVPLTALRSDEGGRGSVAVLSEGRAVERRLRLGLRSLDRVEVLEGLQAGEQLLLDPRAPLGQRLRPVAADARSAQAGAGAGGANAMGQLAGGMR